ncbi:hypothetical protein FQN54_002499 [Arachnomyces sp. PD_36]|nr:hypothetical protein FQN54_002499 [Arachnomyces sp. PD_36]
MPKAEEMTQPHRNDLTEKHLAIHQQSYSSETRPHTTWAEQVVQEERIRAFHSQSGLLQGVSEQENGPQMGYRNVATHHDRPDLQGFESSLKLFGPSEGEHLEDPFQRFLTPGSSDTTLFAKPAMRELNIAFGSMETIEYREKWAKSNVDVARANRKRHKATDARERVDRDKTSEK